MKSELKMCVLICILMFGFRIVFSQGHSSPLIIDHACENLSAIPGNWIDSAQVKIKWHYAHTSRGGQLTSGVSRIEDNNSMYDIARGSSLLPTEADALCIFDGQEHDTYITPDEYWETGAGMNYTRDVLTNNTSLNVSQWSWCTQLNSYSEEATQAYLDSIALLETEFPNITFIYMTCNAQATGSSGYNRYLRNEQIRAYCRDNSKVLFDFADLDACYFNSSTEQWEQSTYEFEGVDVPVEHPQFNGNESGHTTNESCEQKGRAVWWMMARLADWDDAVSNDDIKVFKPGEFILHQNYPNPFNPSTTIRYELSRLTQVKLSLYNLIGQEVKVLVNKRQPAGSHHIDFKANDLSAGIYFYKLSADNSQQVRRMILTK